MDFSFSEVQQELRRQAREWVRDRYPLERAHEVALSDAGWDESTWTELAALGWLGVSVAEKEGGAGLSLLEEAVLFEELGYALYSGPFLVTLIALPALGEDERRAVAAGERRWSIERRGFVPELARVDAVATGEGRSPATGDTLPTMDGTRPLGRLAAGLAVEPLPGAVAPARLHVALALEAVGVAQRALDLGISHAKSREQFGRPIGVYQAVSHPLADAYVDTELARSLAYWAAWSVAEDEPDAPVAAAAAVARATEAAIRACERSIQVHGGIGFTWEHPLHLFYKRAQWIRAFGGAPSEHRRAVAAALVDQPVRTPVPAS
jgi:alkylation response protein AidB-like acyl-CoA dehydrogenase